LQGRVVRDALQVGGAPVSQVTSNWAAAATGWNRTLAYPTGAVWTRSNDRIGRLVALTGPQGNDIALNWQGEFYAGRSHSRGGAPALHELATLDGLGRRVGWDFTAGSVHAYEAQVVRDVVGRVASLTWGFGPSAADHWRGYGYDPATRLADAWSWDGLAPGPDVSSLVNHDVAPGQVGTLAADLAGVVHAPFARAADGGDLLSIGDAYDVTSPRGPGHRLTEVEIDGVAVTVDHDATGRVVEVDPGFTFEYDPDERLMAVRDSGTGDIVERYAYDADGRLAATYDANGLTQRFAWDGAARLIPKQPATATASRSGTPSGARSTSSSPGATWPPTRSATWPCCRSPTTAAASWAPWSPTPRAQRCSPPRALSCRAGCWRSGAGSAAEGRGGGRAPRSPPRRRPHHVVVRVEQTVRPQAHELPGRPTIPSRREVPEGSRPRVEHGRTEVRLALRRCHERLQAGNCGGEAAVLGLVASKRLVDLEEFQAGGPRRRAAGARRPGPEEHRGCAHGRQAHGPQDRSCSRCHRDLPSAAETD
jgi:YD repeat-containing protein